MTAKRLIILMMLVSAAGCGTTGAPGTRPEKVPERLPLEAVRALATEIERAVAGGNRDVQIADRAGLIINTPEMSQAIRTRATRIEILNRFLDTGHAWERRDGLVWVITSNVYKKTGTRQDRDRQALIIVSENRDRLTLYQNLAKVNRLGQGSVSVIRGLFAEARLEFLPAGQKYETETGEVVVKE